MGKHIRKILLEKCINKVAHAVIKMKLFVINALKIKYFRLIWTAAIVVLASAVDVHKFRVGTYR